MTSLRVSGHVLEVSNPTEGRTETLAVHRFPFGSVVADSKTGSVSFEEHPIC